MSIRNLGLLLLFCVFPLVGCGQSEEQKVAVLLAENEADLRSRLNLFEAVGNAAEGIGEPVEVSIDDQTQRRSRSFSGFPRAYSKDQQQVYFLFRPIEGADPETFEVVDPVMGKARDKHGTYFGGKREE